MSNNLKILENFFNNNKNLLIINYINDEISFFYNYCIKYFAEKNRIIIKHRESQTISNNDDLFENQNIYVWNNPKNELLEKVIESNDKNIVFINYKTFKKIKHQYPAINCYEVDKDVKFFVSKILLINNQLLVNSLLSNPELIYSEISKYMVNPGYVINHYNNKTYENLTDIRIKMSEIKKMQPIDLIKLFNLIKEEILIKKFNFLIY